MPTYLGRVKEGEGVGVCILIYGPTNSGKTHACITAPPKVLHINKEPKDPRLVHSIVRPDYSDFIDYVEFGDFEDEQECLNSLINIYAQGKRPYETVFNDSLTFAMANTKSALEAARFEKKEIQARAEPGKYEVPTFTDMAGVEKKDWGTLASLTARSVKLLHQLSKYGVLVVSTAIDSEYPRWNNTIRVAPSLLGQEFPKIMHGYFDTIGYIVHPYHLSRDSQMIAPRVSFISPGEGFSNSYMVRANPRLIEAERRFGPLPLDLTLIARIIRGQQKLG